MKLIDYLVGRTPAQELLYLVDLSRPIMSEEVLVTTWERFTAILRSLPNPR